MRMIHSVVICEKTPSKRPRIQSKGKLPYDKTKFKLNRKRKNKLTNGHGGVIIQLRAAIFERTRNAQIKAVQTVSIFLLSATFSCVLHLWFKRCCCDVVYNDVTRDSIACSLTLRHVTENRYVKYLVHNIHGDMNQLFQPIELQENEWT